MESENSKHLSISTDCTRCFKTAKRPARYDATP